MAPWAFVVIECSSWIIYMIHQGSDRGWLPQGYRWNESEEVSSAKHGRGTMGRGFIPIWGLCQHGAVVPPSRLAIRPVVHEMALREPSPRGGVQVLSG